MTTITASDSWFKRTSRSIHIPPVYIFLVVTFLVSGLLDQILLRRSNLFQSCHHDEHHRPVRRLGNCGGRANPGDPWRFD